MGRKEKPFWIRNIVLISIHRKISDEKHITVYTIYIYVCIYIDNKRNVCVKNKRPWNLPNYTCTICSSKLTSSATTDATFVSSYSFSFSRHFLSYPHLLSLSTSNSQISPLVKIKTFSQKQPHEFVRLIASKKKIVYSCFSPICLQSTQQLYVIKQKQTKRRRCFRERMWENIHSNWKIQQFYNSSVSFKKMEWNNRNE